MLESGVKFVMIKAKIALPKPIQEASKGIGEAIAFRPDFFEVVLQIF